MAGNDLTTTLPLTESLQRLLSVRRSSELVFCLALAPILLAVFCVSALQPYWEHTEWMTLALGIAGAAWVCAFLLARSGSGNLTVIVVGAVALRIAALGGDPTLSDDVYRYAWEGSVVAHGTSPYAFAPAAPELSELASELPAVRAAMDPRHDSVPAVYPPAAQWVFAGTMTTAGVFSDDPGALGVLLLRVFFAVCDLLVLVPLIALLRRWKLPPTLCVVWAWCPLVAIEFAGSGHLDSLGIAATIGAIALFTKRSEDGDEGRERLYDALGACLLAVGILTKLLPIVILPFVLRGRNGLVRAAVTGVVIALLCAPVFLLEGGPSLSGLSTYGTKWESFNFGYTWLEKGIRFFPVFAQEDESVSDPRIVGRALIFLAWATVAVYLFAQTRNIVRAGTVLIGLFLLLTPTLHPWYLAWILPFLALSTRVSWLWVVFTAPLLYWPLAGYKATGTWAIPDWIWLVVAVPFLALAAYEWRLEFAFRNRIHTTRYSEA